METLSVQANEVHESDCDLNCIQERTSRSRNRRGVRSPKPRRDTLVLLSVGGKQFETYRQTLRKVSTCRLANDAFLENHFRKDKGYYFFDRDPTIFEFVLNYLRTGELHLPSYICGPSAKRELEFWGIEDCNIETCCWTNYASWNSTLKALEKLELDRKVTFLQAKERASSISTSFCQRSRHRMWNILNNKGSSKASKIYGWASLIFVFLSIFSLCAETHSVFRVPGNADILGRRFRNNMKDNIPATANENPPNIQLYAMPDLNTASSNDSELSNIDNATVYNTTGGNEPTPSSTGANDNTTLESPTIRTTVAHPALVITSVVSLIFFWIDYSLRIATAPKTCKFITSNFGIIDILALLPDSIEMIVEPFLNTDVSFQVFTIFRIMRVIRILRLMRHFSSLWLLFYTLKASMRELLLLSMFLFVGVLIFSTLIYFAEDSEDFPNIPQAFWWALITMTTVGYGDMYPKTIWGYLVGSMAALSGLLMIGFSVPVLVNNFLLYYTHVQYILDQDEDDKLENNNYHYKRRSSLYESGRRTVAEEDISLLVLNLNNRDESV